MKTVCLLAAGLGTRMGKYAGNINKTMLPVNNKAIISHIVEQFPLDTRFVVAIGFKGVDVKSYLTVAHPRNNFKFVEVDNFQGEGSGPGYSVSRCKPHLEKEFLLIACDALYEGLNYIPTWHNFMGVSEIDMAETSAYCNVKTDDNDNIILIKDKVQCDYTLAATGVWAIHDTKKFWEDLESSELSTGFTRISFKAYKMEWIDLGTIKKYEDHVKGTVAYDFSKPGEMLYFVGKRVIKWFKDDKSAANRITRSLRIRDLPFTDCMGKHLIYHDFVTGKTLNEYQDVELLDKLAQYMCKRIWCVPTRELLTAEDMRSFYMDKTMERVAKFETKYPDFNVSKINNNFVSSDIYKGLMKIDWLSICTKDLEFRSRPIHGDLQFDNIIYDDVADKITLIDWRQDFGGRVDVGDIYYDLAKLIAGSIINYAKIKAGEFTYREDGDKIAYEIKDHITFKTDLVKKAFDITDPIIDQLVTLVFLNMAPLHNPPFDKILYCIALERLNQL